jgi:hypothetical protein
MVVRAAVPLLALLSLFLVRFDDPALAADTGPAGTSLTLLPSTGGSVGPPGGRTFASGTGLTVRGLSYGRGGTAADRVTGVRVTVVGADTRAWLQPNGSFSTVRRVLTVPVAASANTLVTVRGAPTWKATWSWTPPGQPWAAGTGGVFVIDAAAVDASGRVELPAARTTAGMAAPPAGNTAFLTVRLGRTTWQQYRDGTCTEPLGGTQRLADGSTVTGSSVTLEDVASSMRSRDARLFGVGNVVVGRTRDDTRACVGAVEHASWADLARLRSSYGWRFNSAGHAYRDLSRVTDWSSPVADTGSGEVGPPAPTMRANVCGSIDALAAHGHPEARGMFAYPNDQYSDRLQRDLVRSCYSFGRTYRGLTQVRGIQVVDENGARPAEPLWYARTVDVTGGACWWEQPSRPAFPRGTGRACTGRPVPRTAPAEWPTCEARTTRSTNRALSYPDVACLRRMVSTVGPGHWLDIQFARFVRGAWFGAGPTWDCRSSDWRDHWTSAGELTCFDDLLSILGKVPPRAVVTDPLSVAEAWGRRVP